MRRIALTAMFVGILGMAGAAPAFAQPYPGGEPLRPGTECIVFLDGEVVGTGVVGENNICPVALVCPPSLAGETATFVIRGVSAGGDSRVVEVEVPVACPAAPGVAITGTNVSVGMVLLGGLVLGGLALLVISRRKKVHAE